MVDVNDVVLDVEQLLRRTLGEQVELQSSLAEDLRPVLIDPGQLEQILVNLAINARDAMPAGGELRIDTTNLDVDLGYASARPGLAPGPHVRLRVSDTGEGMSKETAGGHSTRSSRPRARRGDRPGPRDRLRDHPAGRGAIADLFRAGCRHDDHPRPARDRAEAPATGRAPIPGTSIPRAERSWSSRTRRPCVRSPAGSSRLPDTR